MNNRNNGYSVMPLFSKVFYYSKLADITPESLIVINQFISQQSYDNCTNLSEDNNFSESTTRFDILETDILKPLKYRILQEFDIFKNEVLRVEDLTFGITTSWATRSKPGKESISHSHSNCFYSGILYINVTPDSGSICFKDYTNNSYVFDEKIKEWNIYNARVSNWTPENRDIVFFPSEVQHQFLVNKSNIDRYSIAFNIIPLGSIGLNDSKFTYKEID